MAGRIPAVVDGVLLTGQPTRAGAGSVDNDRAPGIALDALAWFAWLDDPATHSFAFASPDGAFTARKERRARGDGYWSAYRRVGGVLRKVYLGRGVDLTLARLTAAVAALSNPATPPPAPPRPPDSATMAAADVSPPPSAGIPPLLATKLFALRPRPDLVDRPDLMARLDAGLANSVLTCLSAPAGFGKSTLVSTWLARTTRPAAWLSLDADDDDPHQFLRYLIAALRTVAPDVGTAAWALLQLPSPPPPPTLLTLLINDLASLAQPCLLVLDDYHVLRTPSVHEAVTFLLDHRPPSLQLVIATREDPPLPLARLRARRQLTELRAADLRFTPGEMAAFLERAIGVALTPAQVAALEARTEGWIAGVQLAALAMRDHDNIDAFLAAFTGSHRYLLDYVTEEVLDRQGDQVHEFLIRTAVLERLTAPLCDALLADAADDGATIGDGATLPLAHDVAGPDGQTVLAHLERANLFLIPLDSERRWYRYHHLFGELLRARLRQDRPALVPVLLRRAAAWCERHALVDEALGYALAAGDEAHAAALVEAHAPSALRRGDLLTVRAWLARLPEPLIRARPRLGLAAAMLHLLAGDLAAADARLRGAEQALAATAEPLADLHAELAALRAYQAMELGDMARGPALIEQALATLPALSPWRVTMLFSAGQMAIDQGDLPAAEQAFAETIRLGEEQGNRTGVLMALSGLAACQHQQGRLHRAMATCRAGLVLAEAQGAGRTPAAVLLRTVLCLALYERNEVDEAGRQALLARAINEESGYQTTWSWLAVTLARVQQAQGDPGGARATLDAATRQAQAVDDPWRLAMLAAHRVQLQLTAEPGRRGQALIEAARWEQECGLTPDDALSFHDELLHLTLARVLLADPARQAAGLRLLERLAMAAEAAGRHGRLITILALSAVGLAVGGDRQAALAALARAVALAEPEGVVRPFVDEGAPMAALLRQTAASAGQSAFVAALLAAFPAAESSGARAAAAPRHTALAEPLSERERDVLRLLVAGLPGPEIARELSVGHSTVRTHLKSIYGKLDVHSRDQAIVRAGELRLLDDADRR